MKKSCILLLSLLLLSTVPVSAAEPKAVGWALYTDIVARIDGHPIRSYNVDGYTAVPAEELRGYGFWVVWNASERSLRISRALKDGEPETPEVWPVYTPEPPEHVVGTRAKQVYETDIRTYAAGEWMPHSCNLNGETLVRMDDLASFGSVVWDAEDRTISLTLGDPIDKALQEQIANVEAWRDTAGAGSEWKTWQCPTGTLLLTRYTGTPHGTSTALTFYRKNGERIDINGLLPSAGPLGNSFSFDPRDIEIDSAGERLRLIAPLPRKDSDERVDTLCVFDLLTGRLLSSQPLDGGLTDWQVDAGPQSEIEASGGPLMLTFARVGAEMKLKSAVWPGRSMNVQLGVHGMKISVYAASWLDEAYQNSAFAEAWEALRELDIPDGTQTVNPPELRNAASGLVRVTWNGRSVDGDLMWSRGNNHTDLELSFDEPLCPKDGDTVAVHMGKLS